MEHSEDFRESRTVIEDFSSRTLAAIPSDFGRLHYISTLKDSKSGRYAHDGLTSLYPANAVQAGLAHCHEELFLRILESPLRAQECDFRACLGASGDQFWDVLESWRNFSSFGKMCPEQAPNYLSDLFCSNMNALLAVFSSQRPN